MVQILPGWGDAIAKNLPAIASGIKRLINPYHEIEEGLKQKIATDPKFLDTLVTANQNNPEQFAKVYGPNVQKYLNTLKPSQAAQNQLTLDAAISTQLQDPNTVRDAASRQVTGQTVAGRTIEQAGASRATNEQEASAQAERVSQLPLEEVWQLYNSGGLNAVGDIFTNPKTQAQANYIKHKLEIERINFEMDKTRLLEAGRDRRNQAGIDSQMAKLEQREKQLNEKQIALNNVTVNSFVQRIRGNSQKGLKPLTREEIAAQLPQVNELLQRNQIMKGLGAETAPQFKYVEKGVFQSGHSGMVLVNADGSENAEYDPHTKTTTVDSREQGKPAPTGTTTTIELSSKYKTRGALIQSPEFKAMSNKEKEITLKGFKPTPEKKKGPTLSDSASTETDPVVKQFAQRAVEAELDLDTIKSSESFKKLSDRQKIKIIKSLRY